MKKYFWASITTLLFLTSEVIAMVGTVYDVPNSNVMFGYMAAFMAGWFFLNLAREVFDSPTTDGEIIAMQERELDLLHEHVMELHEMYHRHIRRILAEGLTLHGETK